MNIRTGSAIIATGFLVAALAGCAPASTGGAPSSSPTPAPSPSATPTEKPTTAPEPDPADTSTWIISPEGVGPIEIGGDLAATLDGLPDIWEHDTANCSWTAWWNADDASHGIFFVRGTESDTAPISEITVYTTAEIPMVADAPVTAEGLGLGATKEEVLAAYPGAQEGTAQIGGGTWIMLPGDDEAHVFFEFREGVVTASDVTVTTRSEPSYEVCG
ncbi:3-phosphoshikimate 1-carboxyvinyltransferase [Microbacterium sp. HM58-2]|nr:3-phosphoshikimate 1-carboxyvinyltransferase [Microbacterium sp. HM58-2]